MNSSEKGLSARLYTWSTLGPIFGFGNFCILLTHPSPLHACLSVLLILGLVLSAQVKKYGLYTSLALLVTAFFIQISQTMSWWEFGIFLSIGLNFFVASLSSEEVEDLLYALQAEARVQSKQLNLADLAMKDLKEGFSQEKESYIQEAELHRQRLLTQEMEWKSKETILLDLQEQLQKALEQENYLKSECALYRKEVGNLKQTLSETFTTLHHFEIQAASSEEIEPLKELLKKRDQEIFNLQFQLNSAVEDHRIAQTVSEQSTQEIIRLQELGKIHDELSVKAQEEQILQQALQYEMSEHIETLSREKDLLESMLKKLQDEVVIKEETIQRSEVKCLELENSCSELNKSLAEHREIENIPVEPIQSEGNLEEEKAARRRSEGMYAQLREQFSEKSSILDETRRELFLAQETVMNLQKEREENSIYGFSEMEEALYHHLSLISKEMEEIKVQKDQEIEKLHSLVAVLTK